MFTITGNEDIPDGLYTATLEKVESTDEGGFDGKGYRKWYFLVDVAGVLTPFTGLSSFSTGPDSKSREWLEALMRRELRTDSACSHKHQREHRLLTLLEVPRKLEPLGKQLPNHQPHLVC